MINKMIDVLQEMVKIHQAFNRLALVKTEALKTGDIKTLGQTIHQEEPLTQRLSQLETERQKLITENYGDGQEAVQLSEVIATVPDELKPVLQGLQEELAREVLSLKQRNELNQQLIKQSLDWVQLNINLLDPGARSTTYSRPNATAPQPNRVRSSFDSKA
ncbi:flagellar biosynthesis/type III secretory pathway chaperone [Pullulanibacillus pueri]|uniref:FlgN protein n=1 Tax=Pullulanibacillus pueri TaxID=1437324 RepID=A0A8J2ZUB5_9BACL|nr:flagellar protein FlgN [Pullulanibacillus pueri]MBM7684123.1 flagellar biosynthesis/type III secretory pathway chaperone [Pullulanibacillus pueri]GGH76700.1 hypothetical protein GCM10007096_07520 [Pullulanibacillus pueri]